MVKKSIVVGFVLIFDILRVCYLKSLPQQLGTPIELSIQSIITIKSTPSMKSLIFGVVIYITTGIAQPILIDTLHIHGLLGHKHLLLPTLANTTGMALCGLLVPSSQWRMLWGKLMLVHDNSSTLSQSNGTVQRNYVDNFKRMVILTSIVDLISGMCLTFGILLTGGAIFVILYNSCPAWTALLSKFWLKRNDITKIQFMGVALVCIGLVSNILGNNSTNDTNENDTKSSYFGTSVIFGSIIVLVGSLLHSLMFVLSDASLQSFRQQENNHKHYDDEKYKKNVNSSLSLRLSSSLSPTTTSNTAISISGEMWSCCLGTIEASFMTFWVLIGILTTGFYSNDEYQQRQQQQNHQPSLTYILGGFTLLILIDAAHAAAFFTLLKNIGAVASALLKGIQAVVVILLSALFFCSSEGDGQCLTWNKIASATLVLSGVFAYGVGANDNNSSKDGTSSHSSSDVIEEAVVDHSLDLSTDSIVEMKSLL